MMIKAPHTCVMLGGDSACTVTLAINAASGAVGDTFANFTETMTFAADTNNGRAIISQRLAPTLEAKYPCDLFPQGPRPRWDVLNLNGTAVTKATIAIRSRP